jgi:hypothetical protein
MSGGGTRSTTGAVLAFGILWSEWRQGDSIARGCARRSQRPIPAPGGPALSGSTRRLVVVAKGGGSHQSATR